MSLVDWVCCLFGAQSRCRLGMRGILHGEPNCDLDSARLLCSTTGACNRDHRDRRLVFSRDRNPFRLSFENVVGLLAQREFPIVPTISETRYLVGTNPLEVPVQTKRVGWAIDIRLASLLGFGGAKILRDLSAFRGLLRRSFCASGKSAGLRFWFPNRN